MTMRMYWSNDADGILMWEFIGDWTWDEYHNHTQMLVTMSKASGFKRIDIIVDMTQSGAMPSGIISNVLAGNPNQSVDTGGWGLTVVVGGGVLVRTMLNILRGLSSVIREHYTLANSIAEAKQFIARQRK